jgi:chromosome segregation ATPase
VGSTLAMNLTSLFPPTIIGRLLDDLGAVADAARRLPELEAAVLTRVDSVQRELTAVRQGVERLGERVAPIAEITAVREGVDRLGAKIAPIAEITQVREGVDRLTAEIAPIAEITQVREGVDRLTAEIAPIAEITQVRERLDELVTLVAPIAEIREVRAGIEPLDEDMHAVRHSVDDLEPLIREVIDRLDSLRAELGPLGELADKIPGIG